MNHIQFLIWFIAFQMGLLSLFVSYTKKDKIPYISLHYWVSILVVLGALYRLATMYLFIHFGFEVLPWYIIIFRIFSDSALLYFLPITLHALLMKEPEKWRKSLFFALALMYAPFPMINIFTGFRYALAHKLIYFAVGMYCVLFIMTMYKRLMNKKIRQIVKTIAYSGLAVFVILVFVHLSLNRYINRIHSFIYLVFIFFWLFITIYYLKKYSIEPDELQNFSAKYSLTTREEEIVKLLVLGKTNNDIATNLFISAHTVRTHIQNIAEKLNVKSKLEILSLFHSQRNN